MTTYYLINDYNMMGMMISDYGYELYRLEDGELDNCGLVEDLDEIVNYLIDEEEYYEVDKKDFLALIKS